VSTAEILLPTIASIEAVLIWLLVWNTRVVVKKANQYYRERNDARDDYERIRLMRPDLPERDKREADLLKEVERLENLVQAMRASYRKRLGRGKATVQMERVWLP